MSLYEVQEAADLVTSAADNEVNVIFGSVINENLKDEIIVTVIATGFDESQQEDNQPRQRPVINHNQHAATRASEDTPREREQGQSQQNQQNQQSRPTPSQQEDELDIPTFLRNRNRNR